MPDYIIQKAVNASAVKRGMQRTLDEYARTFEAQHKYDGCCAILGDYRYIKPDYYTTPDSKAITASRTGEAYPCLDGIAEALHAQAPDLVFIGEAWWPGKDQFSQISGEFRRLVRSDRLHFIINDVIPGDHFREGYCPLPYVARIGLLEGRDLPDRVRVATRHAPGSYGCPQAACNDLVGRGGYDGLILRDPDGDWTAGRGTTGEIVKIKRVLSYDLRVLEVNTAVGEKTGRTVYKLVVDFMGKRLGIGSGVPHQFEDVPKVGSIVEIEAMDLSSEGLLREPRYKGTRFDKLEADAA